MNIQLYPIFISLVVLYSAAIALSITYIQCSIYENSCNSILLALSIYLITQIIIPAITTLIMDVYGKEEITYYEILFMISFISSVTYSYLYSISLNIPYAIMILYVSSILLR
jgi:hypothetical protein